MSHMKGLLVGASAVCMASLGLAGCSGSVPGATPGGKSTQTTDTANAQRGGTLNMLGSGDVTYLDPNISYYTIDNQVERLFNRPFFSNPAIPGKETTAAPDLATEIPTADNGGVSADGLTYTIKIRPGVKWNTSPARDVTAQDAVRGLKRTCNPVQPFGGIPDFATLIVGYQRFCDGFAKAGKSPAAMAKYMKDTALPGITAKDDHTVVYKLTKPATYFVDMLTMPAFSPAPVEYLKYAPASAEQAQHTVADGPYQIDSYQPTKSIQFSRNKAWDPATDPIRKAYVDKIFINETSSQDSIQQQLQTGTANADMEFDAGPPPSALPALIAKKDPNLNLGATSSSNPYVVFNTVSPNANKALSKLKVRQALEYGINRKNIIQVIGGPSVNPPLTHVLPDNIVGSKQIDLYPYDVSKAKQLLKEAGYPSGLTLKFLYRNASEGSSKAFQTIQQDLSQIGVKIAGVPSPNADFYNKYLTVPGTATRGVWDLSLAGWGADWYGNAALTYFNPLFSGKPSFPPIGSNFGQYSDKATNDLIEQALAATSKDDAVKFWGQADEQVMKDAAFFPITQPKNANYHATQVHNAIYVPAIQNFDPTNVWLTKDKQGG